MKRSAPGTPHVVIGGSFAGLNTAISAANMARIGPFRHLTVSPALTRPWERAWRERIDRTGTKNGERR